MSACFQVRYYFKKRARIVKVVPAEARIGVVCRLESSNLLAVYVYCGYLLPAVVGEPDLVYGGLGIAGQTKVDGEVVSIVLQPHSLLAKRIGAPVSVTAV